MVAHHQADCTKVLLQSHSNRPNSHRVLRETPLPMSNTGQTAARRARKHVAPGQNCIIWFAALTASSHLLPHNHNTQHCSHSHQAPRHRMLGLPNLSDPEHSIVQLLHNITGSCSAACSTTHHKSIESKPAAALMVASNKLQTSCNIPSSLFSEHCLLNVSTEKVQRQHHRHPGVVAARGKQHSCYTGAATHKQHKAVSS